MKLLNVFCCWETIGNMSRNRAGKRSPLVRMKDWEQEVNSALYVNGDMQRSQPDQHPVSSSMPEWQSETKVTTMHPDAIHLPRPIGGQRQKPTLLFVYKVSRKNWHFSEDKAGLCCHVLCAFANKNLKRPKLTMRFFILQCFISYRYCLWHSARSPLVANEDMYV